MMRILADPDPHHFYFGRGHSHTYMYITISYCIVLNNLLYTVYCSCLPMFVGFWSTPLSQLTKCAQGRRPTARPPRLLSRSWSPSRPRFPCPTSSTGRDYQHFCPHFASIADLDPAGSEIICKSGSINKRRI
jgi:hypothetical protein